MSECEGCCHCRAVSHVNDCSAALAASQAEVRALKADVAGHVDAGIALYNSLQAAQAERDALRDDLERLAREAGQARATARTAYQATWSRNGEVHATIRLLEQGEITTAKALELISEAHLTGAIRSPAPWGKLNWSGAAALAHADADCPHLLEAAILSAQLIESEEARDTAAASLERARLALGGNVSCPWNYKCRITEDRHVDECPAAIARAALAQPTPTATPGTEP